GVVDEQEVDPTEQLEQGIPLPLDPEVHRVACDQTRLADLIQHVELQLGIDVAEEDPLGVPEALGDVRLEVREDAEAGLEGFTGVEVEAVHPRPSEALAGQSGESGEIGIAAAQEAESRLREIVAYHSNHLNVTEAGSGGGK